MSGVGRAPLGARSPAATASASVAAHAQRTPPEIWYRADGPVRSSRPGAHRSPTGHGGQDFRAHVPLMSWPDARRLDLRASLRDVEGRWLVRQLAERQSINVVVVADHSSSMDFAGRGRRRDVVADAIESVAWSAWRQGDRFSFVAADDMPRRDWYLPPTRHRAAAMALGPRWRGGATAGLAALEASPPAPGETGGKRGGERDGEVRGEAHRRAQGMGAIGPWLPTTRSLVFLVSDFHWDDALLQRTLAALARHRVIALVTWDADEFGPGGDDAHSAYYVSEPASVGATGSAPGRWGTRLLRQRIARLADLETGRERLLWWRPTTARRIAQAREARRAQLRAHFDARQVSSVFIEDDFDADAVTRALMR